ncbi:DUF1674 domain-containing protein [Pelagibius marinus]|uniref:DUF1674 domain-containing protein n=1 Tax=Pelagibius marinus TaxID=2762760 RepID=UPI001872460D|nr:succinate dehydrogenase assembly factor 4 [Pelagibius marinus]
MSQSPSQKFTARQPKPRQAPVEPLQEAQKDAGKDAAKADSKKPADKPKELGGPSGPEPTRYGDWERKGICVDF